MSPGRMSVARPRNHFSASCAASALSGPQCVWMSSLVASASVATRRATQEALEAVVGQCLTGDGIMRAHGRRGSLVDLLLVSHDQHWTGCETDDFFGDTPPEDVP